MISTPAPHSAPVPATRLVCRISRSWCSVFGGRHSGHAATCAGCQEYFRSGAALERALRAEAQDLAQTTAVNGGFEQRLLHAVRRARLEAIPSQPKAKYPVWSIGGLGAAAAVAAVGLFFSAHRDPPGLRDAGLANDAAVIVDAVESFSHQLVGTVIPSAGELVATNPLQQEIGSIYSDMRSAIDFLALNFLPPTTLRPEASPSQRI